MWDLQLHGSIVGCSLALCPNTVLMHAIHMFPMWWCTRFHICFLNVGDDFSTSKTTVVIPAGTRTFQVPTFFMIVDDNIDEDEQSFAIIAEIEGGVPDDVTCFQSDVGETGCLGRKGVTEIRITDNDRKFFHHHTSTVYVEIYISLLFSGNKHTQTHAYLLCTHFFE